MISLIDDITFFFSFLFWEKFFNSKICIAVASYGLITHLNQMPNAKPVAFVTLLLGVSHVVGICFFSRSLRSLFLWIPSWFNRIGNLWLFKRKREMELTKHCFFQYLWWTDKSKNFSLVCKWLSPILPIPSWQQMWEGSSLASELKKYW